MRASSSDRVPLRTRLRSLERPARENGWHGTPPATRSTDVTPHAVRCERRSLGSVRSPSCPSPRRFATCVRTQSASESAPTSTEKPASCSPRLRPPAPAKRSTAVGRGADRTHRLTASRSAGSGASNGRSRARARPLSLGTAVRSCASATVSCSNLGDGLWSAIIVQMFARL